MTYTFIIINYMTPLIHDFILIQMEIVQIVHGRVHFAKWLPCLLAIFLLHVYMKTIALARTNTTIRGIITIRVNDFFSFEGRVKSSSTKKKNDYSHINI